MIPTNLFGPSKDPNFNRRAIVGIDGSATQAFGEAECCPPSLCNIDPCGFICAFMEYMPRGPMWDFWKRYRASQMRNLGNLCTTQSCQDNNLCLTVIDHAIYTAKKLLEVLQNPLQTAIWEANPITAFNTRQYWLDSFGWEDCFEGPAVSKKLGFPTPYQAVCNNLLQLDPCSFSTTNSQMSPEINAPNPDQPNCSTDIAANQMSPAIPVVNINPIIDISTQVKAACPPNLLLALQWGILRSLVKLSVGIIPNLESINDVLAPLGAGITISFNDMSGDCAMDCNQMSPEFPDCVVTNINDCDQMTGLTNCKPYQPCMSITLANIGTTLPAGPGITEPLRCDTQKQPKTTINSYYEFPGIQIPVMGNDCPAELTIGAGTIWPGTMAAACILMSVIPSNVIYSLNIEYPTL